MNASRAKPARSVAGPPRSAWRQIDAGEYGGFAYFDARDKTAAILEFARCRTAAKKP
jgi:hypothetical protein